MRLHSPQHSPALPTARASRRTARRSVSAGTVALVGITLLATGALATTTRVGTVESVVEGAGRAEVAGSYGAPAGLGHHALELDTVTSPTGTGSVSVSLAAWGDAAVLPTGLYLRDLTGLSVWMYRDGQSVDAGTPTVGMHLDLGAGWTRGLELRAADNPGLVVPADRWTQVDLHGSTVWSFTDWDPVNGSTLGEWIHGDPRRSTATMNEVIATLGQRTYPQPALVTGLSIAQNAYLSPVATSLFTAVDGLTVRHAGGETTLDFEARVTSADECKNGGWTTAPGGPWKNQGACIAAFLTSD